MPQSRNSKFSNFFRQLDKFSSGLKLNHEDRYWKWAGFNSEIEAKKYLVSSAFDEDQYKKIKSQYLSGLDNSMCSVLMADTKLILPNDMLTKVDLMSMASSLEVRTPFLDHNLVNFVFNLPDQFKIDKNLRKKILQESFKKDLPPELFNRSKKGFEVPLLKWFQNELKSVIDNVLGKAFIEQQGIFNFDQISMLKKKLFSNNPGDAHATVWALIVFQNWWKKYFE